MIFDLKATESSLMKQFVVISNKKRDSFGVISASICLAAAAGLSGVACASRGHHPPLQAEPRESGKVPPWWEKRSLPRVA